MAYRNNTTLSKYLQPGRIVTLVCHSLVKWGHIWRALKLLIYSSPGNVQIKINDNFQKRYYGSSWQIELWNCLPSKLKVWNFFYVCQQSRIVKLQFLQAFNFDSWQLAALLASVSFLEVLINNDLHVSYSRLKSLAVFST